MPSATAKTRAPMQAFMRKVMKRLQNIKAAEVHFGYVANSAHGGPVIDGTPFKKVVVYVDGEANSPSSKPADQSTTATPVRMRYLASYNNGTAPAAGDAVLLLKIGTHTRAGRQYVCVDKMA